MTVLVENISILNDSSCIYITTKLYILKIKMNHYIRPICLPDVTDLTRESFAGRTAKVIGWGYQSLDTTHINPLPSRLKHLKVELLDNKVLVINKQNIIKVKFEDYLNRLLEYNF